MFQKKKKQGNVISPRAKSEGRFCRSKCLIESPSLDVCECKVMSKQRKLSAFFGQPHKEETAETSMANDEAEHENDRLSVTKSKLPK